MNKKTVLVFGFFWVEVDGVAYFLQKLFPSYVTQAYYTLESLLNDMEIYPDKQVILVVQPHSHAYFLYQMTHRYPGIQTVVLASKLYFSDKVILDFLQLPGIVFDEFIELQYDKILNLPVSQRHPIASYDKERFIGYINYKILNQLATHGLSRGQIKVLTLLAKGHSGAKISRLMNISHQAVSRNKINGLMKLPYPKDRLALIKGLQATCNTPISYIMPPVIKH